jgi:predicted ArsR family transcriptional regulator
MAAGTATDEHADESADQILFLMKTRGPKTAQQLADLLGLTSMGARRQLEAAQEKGWCHSRTWPTRWAARRAAGC